MRPRASSPSANKRGPNSLVWDSSLRKLSSMGAMSLKQPARGTRALPSPTLSTTVRVN